MEAGLYSQFPAGYSVRRTETTIDDLYLQGMSESIGTPVSEKLSKGTARSGFCLF
jgi:hypothetical protein